MKTVLITGASSGIGEACARYFAVKGDQVILTGRSESHLKKISSEIGSLAHYFVCDLEKKEDIAKLCAFIKSKHPTLSTIINNAGIYTSNAFEKASDADWEKTFTTNLLAPVRILRELILVVEKNKNPSILNISSTLGLRPMPGTLSYSALKAALNNLTMGLALELAPKKIRVNCICPGVVETPIHQFVRDHNDAQKKQMAEAHPLKRIGKPEEIAAAAYFLSSEESLWTTGSILCVDGGINLS